VIIFNALLDVEPVAKGRPKFVVRGKFATAYTPKKTRDFEALVSDWARKVYKHKPSEKALSVTINASFTKPKTNKKKYHTQKPDADNMKSVLDALNNIVYKDDCQIIELFIYKQWSDRGSIHVTVKEIE
jgi:Holliday junction resolvase RusA-like endonuclease